MWEQWGVEISAFPLTLHIAYTTACCYRTSCDMFQDGENLVEFMSLGFALASCPPPTPI